MDDEKKLREKQQADEVIIASSDSDNDCHQLPVQSHVGAVHGDNLESAVSGESSLEINEVPGTWNSIDILCDKYSSSASSESDESGGEKDDCDLESDLRSWVVDCNVSHTQLDKLLPILRKLRSDLPLTSKTLMKVPGNHNIDVKTVSGGDFVFLVF